MTHQISRSDTSPSINTIELDPQKNDTESILVQKYLERLVFHKLK